MATEVKRQQTFFVVKGNILSTYLGQAKYIYSFASAPASHKMPLPQANFRAGDH